MHTEDMGCAAWDPDKGTERIGGVSGYMLGPCVAFTRLHTPPCPHPCSINGILLRAFWGRQR